MASVRRKNGVVGVQVGRPCADKTTAAALRFRIKSMPTLEEHPGAEARQSRRLRASLSTPCDRSEVAVFPSLGEHLLADLLDIQADENANNTSERDLENKFSSLALAFKTDRLTLQERLDVQRRHRDQAEHNLELETQRFREQLMHFTQSDEDRSGQLKALQRQVEIFKQISQRLSCTAEVLGAVQQELRVSHAVEVMTQHVENLRHLYDREHAELEEARRVLASNKLALHEPASGGGKPGPPGRRRASIAVFAPRPGGEPRPGLPATVAPPSGPPPHSLLKRRRNSLGGGDGDGFACITEERDEEGDQNGVTSEAEQTSEESLKLYSTDDDGELRSHADCGVSDELASLRSEQEQLANDLRALLSRQTGAVIEQTTTAGRVVWDLVRAWPYSREETAAHVRYCCGGLFLLLAVMVLLVSPALGGPEPDWPAGSTPWWLAAPGQLGS